MNLPPLKFWSGMLVVVSACVPAFAQVSNFDSLNGYTAGLETRLAGARALVTQFSDSDFKSHLVLSSHYVDREIGAAADRLKRNGDETTFTAGYNWAANDLYLGAAIATVKTTSDYVELNSPAPKPLEGNVDGDTLRGVVWAGSRWGKVSLGAVASFSQTSNDGVRRSDIGTSRADYDSTSATFGVRLAYTTEMSESLQVTPFAALSFASADADGFTEQGTSADRRILRDFSLKDDRAIVGVRLSAKESQWTPFGTIAWFSRLSGSGSSVSSSASNGSNLGTGFVPASNKNLFYVGAGLRGKLNDQWVADASLDYSKGGEEKQVGFSLAIRRLF